MSFCSPHKMFEKPTALFTDFEDFEQKIHALAQRLELDLPKYEIDHLSLRVNTAQTAQTWLALLLKQGSVLSDNVVNGRVIYLILLDEPIRFAGQWVDVVELPLPKDKHYPQETWEHIEVVVPFLANETADEWMARIKKSFLRNQFSDLTVKASKPKASGEILDNLSVAVSFFDKTHNHTCIKFHPYSIKKIINAV
ncbi:VOC family protein [Aggregatibacter actinomycetemcomitans]|uniref:VOC family protein n=1 Tax=Aggregatibacter actinomycetemcomitans TaxID=714 RepID=UPI00197CA136|nr:VOC family protein [Aggregatibacter actinomycetemcomitans]MBN6063515.1 VOC family protein [Aggregatibacter actinomycetemcomitans]MBN6081742.1 VOC family protein [Aggregatibacter actinomycetemcomitans]MBN6083398.1 VOC family protein [Aggregatibacter actinomycetemcomitans]